MLSTVFLLVNLQSSLQQVALPSDVTEGAIGQAKIDQACRHLVAVCAKLLLHDSQGSFKNVTLRLMLAKPPVDATKVYKRCGNNVVLSTILSFVDFQGAFKKNFLSTDVTQPIVRIAKVGQSGCHVAVVRAKDFFLNLQCFLQVVSLHDCIASEAIGHTQIMPSCANDSCLWAIEFLELLQSHSSKTNSCWAFIVMFACGAAQVQQKTSSPESSFQAVSVKVPGRATADARTDELSFLLKTYPTGAFFGCGGARLLHTGSVGFTIHS
mmetsp:Transcript_10347/g.18428  ORF Transcript_10347/g.18428 Transcript_10347/m.18428 type:complete len:267 (-) Transcript_10347:234-1034(-)